MIYQSRAGDSFLSIARNLTLDPGYAFSIAEVNGLASESENWSADAKAALVTGELPAGTNVEIPDDWLRQQPGFLTRLTSNDSFFKWAGLAIAVVALLKG